MKTFLNMIISLMVSLAATAQINLGGIPHSWKETNKIEVEIPIFKTSVLNMDEIKAEDEEDEQNGIPPRFGFKHEVDLNIENVGVWTELPNGDKLWQVEVYCPNAKSINFTFNHFWLPEGGRLFVYSKDKQHRIGAFSERNNKGDSREEVRGFATGLVYGDRVVLEYYQPSNKPKAVISINGIVHGYRYIADLWNDFNGQTKGLGDSGGCQVNVNCSPEGDDWQDEKTGVALILVNGNRNCTGSLINNSCNDGTLYFLTADHCIGGLDASENTNADNWSFVWNYEAPGCSNPNSEPPLYTTSGATLRANNALSDFALFELDESPYELSPQQRVMFNGWSRTNSPSAGGVGIHHPRGDVKKIATHNMVPLNSAVNGNIGYYNPNNFWEINWSITANGYSVTEGISSGSPLFTDNGFIIGQLLGGDYINCDDPANDEGDYGKISVSWNANSNINRQLEHWLDPCNTDLDELEGGYLENCESIVVFNEVVSVNAEKQAGNDLFSASIIENGASATFTGGRSVNLTPGFHARAGSDFLARIESCEPGVVPVPKNAPEATISYESDESETVFTNEYPEWVIVPNPATSQAIVKYSNVHKGLINVAITDVSGRLLGEYQTSTLEARKNSIQMDLSKLNAGIYWVRFSVGNFYEVKKLIVQ